MGARQLRPLVLWFPNRTVVDGDAARPAARSSTRRSFPTRSARSRACSAGRMERTLLLCSAPENCKHTREAIHFTTTVEVPAA